MKKKIFGFSNGYFWVEQLADKVILATITSYPLSAEAWNTLRDNICTNSEIPDDVTVYFDYLYVNGETDRFSYVTVENWRMLGFSGGNIKNCIDTPADFIVTAANEHFYKNIHQLKYCVLPPKRKERVIAMINRSHYIEEFKETAINFRNKLKSFGWTDDMITDFFMRLVEEVYHPKC